MTRFLPLLLGIALFAPTSAQAQAQATTQDVQKRHWDVCFEPGLAVLRTDGYLAAHEAALGIHDLDDNPLARPIVSVTLGRLEARELLSARYQTLVLELMRSGFNRNYADGPRVAYSGGPADDCYRLSIAERRPPRTWHSSAIYFEEGSAVLSEVAKYLLRWNTAGYEPGRFRVVVRGYADTAGSVEASQRISERRAAAASDYLVRLGVDWNDIETSAAGERELAKPSKDGVAEPLNRRVTTNMWVRTPPR